MGIDGLHIILNGEVYRADEAVLKINNRAFCYGDAVFESMHAFGSRIQFAEEHFERLFSAIKAFKMEALFTKDKLLKDIQRLINRDKLFGGVRIRLTVYRDSEGLYTPKNNKAGYVISCQSLDYQQYVLNNRGNQIGVFSEIRKPINQFSAYKTANSLLNVMAGIYCQEQQLDDCLIMNEKGQIIEGYHSNLFLVKNNTLYTPDLTQACVNGIMRNQVIKIASSLDLKVNEQIAINEEVLLQADEIFLTNAIEGLRWVLAFKNRRYYNRVSKALTDKLNESFFS